eukprot:COSAG02_NODE_3885_length_6087_cov_7.811456_3_plen_192_part_00
MRADQRWRRGAVRDLLRRRAAGLAEDGLVSKHAGLAWSARVVRAGRERCAAAGGKRHVARISRRTRSRHASLASHNHRRQQRALHERTRHRGSEWHRLLLGLLGEVVRTRGRALSRDETTGADPGFRTGGEFRIIQSRILQSRILQCSGANMAGSEFNPPQSEYNTTIISMVMRNKKQRLEVVRGVQCSYQ